MEEQVQPIEVIEQEVTTSLAGVVRRSALFVLLTFTVLLLAVAVGSRFM